MVAQYATLYQAYDATGRVSRRRVLGGSAVTFSYEDGYPGIDDLNKYRLKTIETRVRRQRADDVRQLPEPGSAG